MKNFRLIIYLAFLALCLATGQIRAQQSKYVFAPDWEEFSIETAEAFPLFDQNKSSGVKRNAAVKYKTSVNKTGLVNDPTYFFIFSDPLDRQTQTDKVFEFIKYSGNGRWAAAEHKRVFRREV